MRKNFGAKPYTYPQPVLIIAAIRAVASSSITISKADLLHLCSCVTFPRQEKTITGVGSPFLNSTLR